MQPSIEAFRAFASTRKVAVLGVGISNRPLIAWLHALGIKVAAFDRLDEDDPYLMRSRAALEADGIYPDWHLGEHYLDGLPGFDLIFRTPRMQPDEPALMRAKAAGAIVTSEMELFLTLCPAPVIGITGSDGKTTTTTLIYEMLKAEGYHTYVGGNIGTPLLDRVFAMDREDRVVVELSSFQLVSMHERIETAVITNITPNHLDVHHTFADYVSAKKNIYLHQSLFDRLILNAHDSESMKLLGEAVGRVELFGHDAVWPQPTAFYRDGMLIIRDCEGDHEIVAASDIVLPGQFNRDNVATAALAVWPSVGPEAIRRVATTFRGVPHRLELVRTLDNVKWYNSSIDSSPTRSMASLQVFAEGKHPLILITGGADKNSNYTGLGSAILKATSRIILCGANAPQILASIEKEAEGRTYEISEAASYDAAVQKARAWAEPGDSVLLSPAGTSFDRFRHFEERGDQFRDLVNAL